MALEFTNIPDRNGAAIYIMGDGSSQTESKLIDFGNQVDSLTPDEVQVVYLDPSHGDGLSIKEFYQLNILPCIIIVMDDDTIPYQWDNSLPRPDEVAYTLTQINGSMRAS